MVIIINLEVYKMNKNEYSIVDENVKVENDVDDDIFTTTEHGLEKSIV